MEALVCRKTGDPTVPMSSPESPLSISAAHPVPVLASPTGVLVRVRATSINYATYLQMLGKYQERPPLPFVPGSDFSGVVEAVGPAVSRFRPGDRVCSLASLGSFAQLLVVDEKHLFLVPEGCDLVAAGALPVAFGTSHVGLLYRARLKSGQGEHVYCGDGYLVEGYRCTAMSFPKVLLVLGAAGGVGASAIQIGKICGAIVIAVARGTEKTHFLKSLGVDHVVDTTECGLLESVKQFLKSRNLKGVDVLYDPVGGKLTKDSMRLLNWGAQILVIGFASGEVPVIPANIALVKNWTIHGLYWGSYKIYHPRVLEDSLKELLTWLSKGLISINISHRFRLSEANLAFSAIRDRKVIGKVMIVFDNAESAKARL